MKPPEKELVSGLLRSKNPQAHDAYQMAIYGLIPVAGLLLGARAIQLGLAGCRVAAQDAKKEGLPQARAGIFLGALEVLTNGIGLILIGIGAASLMAS
jgi:hypothetical protein